MNSTDNHRYIFCVSPGRSGSHYLQRVLACAHDICAVHEPEHQYSKYAHLKPGRWDLKNTPFADTADERQRLKLGQINDLLAKTGKTVYAETNPLFSTIWHDVIMDALSGQDVTVIILRRNASAVLKSLLDLGWFQGKDGNRWMVTAWSVNSLVQAPVRERQATPAERIIGHLLNVERYAQRIREQCESRGYRIIELVSENLFSDVRAKRLLAEQCGLSLDPDRLELVERTGRNKQTLRKKAIDTPLEECRHSIEEYLLQCRQQHLKIPELLYS
jgi:hypothetical protein